MVAGTSSIYEILLIVLVLVLIFNGFLRSKLLSKQTKAFDHNSQNSNKRNPDHIKGEYVDYEIVNENTTKDENR